MGKVRVTASHTGFTRMGDVVGPASPNVPAGSLLRTGANVRRWRIRVLRGSATLTEAPLAARFGMRDIELYRHLLGSSGPPTPDWRRSSRQRERSNAT